MKDMFNLFRRKPKTTLDDPVFGMIEFNSYHGIGMWSHIPADSECYMILVEAPKNGPSQLQRDFYSGLRDNLNAIESECKAFIATQGPPPNLLSMTIYSVEIGSEEEIERKQFVIELSDRKANEIYRVEFRNGKPAYYGVDD